MSSSSRLAYAQQLTDLIVQELRPDKVILFGSVAKGLDREDSDIDLFIVQDTPDPYPMRTVPAGRLSWRLGHPYPSELIIYTPQEYKKAIDNGSVFLADILTEGKVLYDRESQS